MLKSCTNLCVFYNFFCCLQNFILSLRFANSTPAPEEVKKRGVHLYNKRCSVRILINILIITKECLWKKD